MPGSALRLSSAHAHWAERVKSAVCRENLMPCLPPALPAITAPIVDLVSFRGRRLGAGIY